MFSSTLKHTLPFKVDFDHTEDVCPFIAYCVTEFKTVCLIFWRFLFLQ